MTGPHSSDPSAHEAGTPPTTATGVPHEVADGDDVAREVGSRPSAVSFAPGDEVAGVRLSALVGEGGSGQVWSGTEVATGHRVAVKLLRSPAARREAVLQHVVRHPHVLAVRRVVDDPPALVCDLAAGGSLAAQVAARGTLAPGEVVTVLAPLADALAALHAQGVVHGDVTGTNVLFVDRGRPVLADLGCAGVAGDGDAWATPGYAAPEVVAGAAPGPAADVHGLAAVAWLALTGAVPPAEPDRLPLRLLAPDAPEVLVAAVSAALDPDPLRRPAPEELATAARASCPGLPVRLVPGAALGVRPEEAVTYRVRLAAATDDEPPAPWWRRGRGALARVGAGPRPRWSLVAGTAVTVVVLAAAAAAVGLVVAPLVPGWSGGDAQDGSAAAGTPSVAVGQAAPPVVAPTEATAPPAPAAPTAPTDPTEDLRVAAVGLVAARERALRAGDVDALALVHAPGSVALAADQRLAEDGPLDVDYEVLDVEPAGDVPGAVSLRLRTTTGGTTVTELVVLDLVEADGGWRVAAVGR